MFDAQVIIESQCTEESVKNKLLWLGLKAAGEEQLLGPCLVVLTITLVPDEHTRPLRRHKPWHGPFSAQGPFAAHRAAKPLAGWKDRMGPDVPLCVFWGSVPLYKLQNSSVFPADSACGPPQWAPDEKGWESLAAFLSPQQIKKEVRTKTARVCWLWKVNITSFLTVAVQVLIVFFKWQKGKVKMSLYKSPLEHSHYWYLFRGLHIDQDTHRHTETFKNKEVPATVPTVFLSLKISKIFEKYKK